MQTFKLRHQYGTESWPKFFCYPFPKRIKDVLTPAVLWHPRELVYLQSGPHSWEKSLPFPCRWNNLWIITRKKEMSEDSFLLLKWWKETEWRYPTADYSSCRNVAGFLSDREATMPVCTVASIGCCSPGRRELEKPATEVFLLIQDATITKKVRGWFLSPTALTLYTQFVTPILHY